MAGVKKESGSYDDSTVGDHPFPLEHHNVAEICPSRPKDPRSKAKYNILSRLFFLLVHLKDPVS